MQPMSPPELIILVGGNGSGKSTYFDLYLKKTGLPFVNADLIAREIFGKDAEKFSMKAARLAEDARMRLIQRRESFCFETVFSHPSKIDFLAQAKAMEYRIKMIAIYTDNMNLNVARVAQRVKSGGHNVPEEKIMGRIPRTHMNIAQALVLCDQFVLLDNSSFEQPFRLKLATDQGELVYQDNVLPDFWRGLSARLAT